MTPEQIAEGRRLLEAWRASESTGLLSERLGAMEATCWLFDNAGALLDAAERAGVAECELYGAHIELRRMQADELPGGWTEQLQIAIDARHNAERELAEAQESLQAGRDLMAVVHGDGGHYREQYGDRKASEDAITIVGALRVAYDDAMHKLSEAQADSERFEWWFSSDVDKRNFMPTYSQGIRERWSLSTWRAAIDAERGK